MVYVPMQLHLEQPSDILGYLNRLTAEEQSGEVLLQNGTNSAKVYVNNGLIVWAFAAGQQESFQAILIKENQIPKERLLEGIRDARQQGKKSLDEILLTLGVAEHADRAHIIERHTRSALRTICTWQQCTAQFSSSPNPSPTGIAGLTLASLLNGTGVTTLSTIPAAAPASSSANEGTHRMTRPVLPQARPSYKPEQSTATAKDIPDMLQRLRMEVPSFIAAMLIEGKTGMPIATVSEVPELDIEAVSAFYRDLNRSALEALRAMGKDVDTDCPLDEVLLTSKDDFVLLWTLKNGAHLLYLLIDKSSNPGMARVVVRRYLEQLNSFLS